MLDSRPHVPCCGRCAGIGVADRALRRARHKAALFPLPADVWPGKATRSGAPSPDTPPVDVAVGVALDASPHVLAIAGAEGERNFTLAPGAQAWRGLATDPTAIQAGDPVVVRLSPGRRNVADKVWARIGRATGTIVDRHADTLVVDEGATRRRQTVLLSSRAMGRIQVRFPELAPGHLVDVIGMRRGAALEALIPATALPPAFGPGPVPRRPTPAGHGESFRGSATWHEPTAPGEAPEGLAYPAIDPASGCAEAAPDPSRALSSGLPLLAVGSMVQVRNECTGTAGMLPVTTCGAVAGMFADRCLTCGTSPRSRIADLTVASFVKLGGELERGCFNASVTAGW